MSVSPARNYVAAMAIPPYRIVKFAADGVVTLATAATDNIIGVVSEVGPNLNERCDVFRSDIALVEAGAAFSAGQLLTTDASGRAIAAIATPGTNIRLLGVAEESATAAGDVVRVWIAVGSFQG